MKTEAAALHFIHHGHKNYLPHMSIDCVIFGYHDQQLKILLLKSKGLDGWALPGGFIKRQEPMTQAAHRILEERTLLKNLFLQQFHTFGDSPYRVGDGNTKAIIEKLGISVEEDNWLLERTLSIGYFALVDYSKVTVNTNYFTADYKWCDVNEVPPLLFDHNDMVEKALVTLRLQIYHQPIGINLLPEKFTLPEIHVLYETILGKELDRRNFPKKLLALGLIKKLNEQRHIGAHRSPYLYQFNKENYEQALKEGIVHAY